VESLYLLIPIALVFCIIAIRLLLWAINSGQYEDLDKEAWRILADDEVTPDATEKPGNADTDRREP
jgi:cbb3-type cytochrome oxidase maturation protein